MFMRLRKSPAVAVNPAPQPATDHPEDALVYFSHQADTRPLRPMTALEQMYAYYTDE
ncbi:MULTISPECIES: hypothetical protein [Gemmobacter]|jgi:hypothetical protein|uniref:Uncharacterized protein n=2 Tax=Gemmobacter TaxID=204456 RepID=A0A2T6AYN6_9RHOB|nr:MULTISPECIES: hypothetical protein [Gemmobacter]PTX48922.1 hypothetical protein C8N34_10828 [Gemmobacter caeni]TWI99077.1 hypothetical protein IQ03_02606 [Gemmobacter caeni]GHC32089.1 hypothetical protein GCM10007291_36350 [Gemmobacter nanjingensis]